MANNPISLLSSLARVQSEVERMRVQLLGTTTEDAKSALEKDFLLHQHTLSAERSLAQTASSTYFSRICLTGGPCAGKTTAMTHINERLRERGYQVFVVPEAATLIFEAGVAINPAAYTDPMRVKFQYHLMQLQMMLEDIFYGIASTTGAEKVVLLCDRGAMDSSAYLGPELWAQLLYDYGLNESKLRDHRYDQVIHLTTAADGAESFYQTTGNSARIEPAEEARRIDGLLMRAWMQHPNFVLIHNNPYKDFGEKLEGVLASVFQFLGEPLSCTFYKKFIVANPRGELAALLQKRGGLQLSTFNIEDHIFFEENGLELRYYRKRLQDETALFTLCRKVFREGQLTEHKRLISYKEFRSVATQTLPNKYVLQKQRATFTYKGSFMLLDTMTVDGMTLTVLTTQVFQQNGAPEIPELIKRNIAWEANNGPVELLEELLVRNVASIIGDKRARLEQFSDELID